MFLTVFTVLIIVVPFVAHVYLKYLSAFVRKTNHIPGPKPSPFVGNYLDFGSTPNEAFENILRLSNKYGKTVKLRFGPKYFLLTTDPRHIEVFLSCTTNITKGVTYSYLLPWLGTGLLTATGSKWRDHRKLLTPAFHFKNLEKSSDSFNKNGNILVKLLKKHVNGGVFNLYEYINLNTLDIICESALGISVNAQEKSTSEYVAAIKGMAAVFVERMFAPWLHFDQFFFTWSLACRNQTKYLKILHDTSNKVIRERQQEYERERECDDKPERNDVGMKKRYAFLDLLLDCARTRGNLTTEEIREEVDTFMFEGHDTTASALTFCLRLLALHPNVQDRVYEELKMIFGSSSRDITHRDLNEMKYLECVVKESLRLFPSVPLFSRELDTRVQFDNLDLPAGTNVCFNVYALHRNPDIFPNPEAFDPDRFLPENAQGRHPFAYIPFSAGPRNCIGQKFALMEMKGIISKVLLHYKLFGAESHKLKLSWEFVLRSTNGVFLKIVDRN